MGNHKNEFLVERYRCMALYQAVSLYEKNNLHFHMFSTDGKDI